MTPLRALIALAALGLAACGAEAPPPEAAAPPPEKAAPETGIRATTAADGSIRVTGRAADEDALAAHHCHAARYARVTGASTLEWVGGIAKKLDEGVDATLAYESSTAPGPVSVAAAKAPAEGGAAPVESWLIYCDEAGLPREGEA